MILSRCSTNFPNTEPMAGSYSCDDQTRIHVSKEGIPFIALRITLSFLHWLRKSYERLFKTCALYLRKKNACISNHHTHWKHSENLKEERLLTFSEPGLWAPCQQEERISMSIQLLRATASFITPSSGNHPKLIKRINKYKLIDKGRF